MLITKKKHKLLIEEEYKKQKRLQQKFITQGIEHRQAEKDLKRNLAEVINNLSRISLVKDYNEGKNRWRIVLELDAHMMSFALERGNDKEMISYIGDIIKEQAERQIMSCNIQRPEDFNLGRPSIFKKRQKLTNILKQKGE